MTWLLWTMACSAPNVIGNLPPAEVDVTEVGEITLPTEETPRGWRRMDIEQLDASIRRVTGGIGWDDTRGNSEFSALSATLGVPDYLDSTTEDLEPSLLFQKFLDDAANQVCEELVRRELQSTSGRVLMGDALVTDTLDTNREAIESALSNALKRFHGRTVEVDSPKLEPWTFLFESATLVTSDSELAWRTVCVGLLTHPDFYTY